MSKKRGLDRAREVVGNTNGKQKAAGLGTAAAAAAGTAAVAAPEKTQQAVDTVTGDGGGSGAEAASSGAQAPVDFWLQPEFLVLVAIVGVVLFVIFAE